jgi:hypothetical protein
MKSRRITRSSRHCGLSTIEFGATPDVTGHSEVEPPVMDHAVTGRDGVPICSDVGQAVPDNEVASDKRQRTKGQ